MTNGKRSHVDDLRGASRLAIEATQAVTNLVEAMHRTIASGPGLLGEPLAGPARLVTSLVYGGVRGVTGLVGGSIELALTTLGERLGASAPGPEREAVVAALNGVLGDYLAASGNPLAIAMRFRRGGLPLQPGAASLADANGKILILAHGSCMNDRQFCRRGHDHGAALARDLGYTPVYLHYNSGLHISENGRAFDALLEELVAAWPVPVRELVILGHSMGGLVARSACHVAEAAGHAWRTKLTRILFVGTPFHGAPLERAGNWVDVLLGVSRYSAPLARLGKIRSAGVTDLRYGNVLDEHWQGRDRFAMAGDPRRGLSLPRGVACHAIAATLSREPGDTLLFDGMVPVASALGRHEEPRLTLDFPEGHTWCGYGLGHMDLLDSPAVYETLRRWLEASPGVTA